MRRERGKALVRALHLSELEAAGAARKLALHRADEELDRIARLLPDALQGGLTLSEVARVTGVSRPTLYELRARFADSPGDVRFGVLQAVARMQMVTEDELAEYIGRDNADTREALAGLERDELIEVGARDTEDGPEAEWGLTPLGYETLEFWTFQEDEEERGEEL